MLKSKAYIVKDIDEDNIRLTPLELLESPETASTFLSSCRDKWTIQIDYVYDYCGYDKNDDFHEAKRVSYTLGELLEKRSSVGCVLFDTAAFALRSGSFRGVIIEEGGKAHLLTIDNPVKVSAKEKVYDHREYSTHATFTLIRSEG